MTTHRDVAGLVAALYGEAGAPSVNWTYRTPTRDAPIYSGMVTDADGVLNVVSRGSFTFWDWIRDVNALAYSPHDHPRWGPVHPGFMEGVEETWGVVRRVRISDQPVRYVGHSKGAANSQLLAARHLDSGAGTPVGVLCWGEPKSGFRQLADYLSSVPCTSYQNGDAHSVDTVTLVPFAMPPENYVHRVALTRVTSAAPPPSIARDLDVFGWHHFALYASVTPTTPT